MKKYQDLFILMNDRLAYDKALSEYNSRSKMYRLFHKAPVAPCSKTARELAQEYTEEFNRAHNLQIRRDYGNGDSSWIELNYDGNSLRPVVRAVMVYHGCIFESRKFYTENGDFEEWGICGRYRDGGMTLTDETAAHMNADYLQEAYKLFKKFLDKVANDFWII